MRCPIRAAVRERDDALVEFTTEAGVHFVDGDGKRRSDDSLLVIAPLEPPTDCATNERLPGRLPVSPSARVVRELSKTAVALFHRCGVRLLRTLAAVKTGVSTMYRTWSRLVAWTGARSRSTRTGLERSAAHVRAAAAILRRQSGVLMRGGYDAIAARHMTGKMVQWRDYAHTIRPFVLGIIVGGLLMGYERLIPERNVTGFVPEKETAVARPETGQSARAVSARQGQPPTANDAVPTVATISPEHLIPSAPKPPAPAPKPPVRRQEPQPFRGSLRVTSTPEGAEVFLNGRAAGTTPVVLSDLPVGSRAVRVSLEGYDRWSRAVQVVANRRTEVNAVLTPPRPVLASVAWE